MKEGTRRKRDTEETEEKEKEEKVMVDMVAEEEMMVETGQDRKGVVLEEGRCS